MIGDATHPGLVGLETGDPSWRDAVYAELPLTAAELAEVVDEATPSPEGQRGADAPTTLRLVREVRESRAQLAAVRAYLKSHDEYDRELLTCTRDRQVELAGARSDTFSAMREVMR